MPFAERAAHRCEKPRRSSTRHNNSVVPSRSRVAAGLKTACAGYGQSLAERIGLRALRWNNVAKPCDSVMGNERAGDLGTIDRAHVDEGEKKGQRRLGALVFVRALDMKAVPAPAGRRVIE